MKTIYLAGGCFWGVQGYFDLLRGVVETNVGYANSRVSNPSYELVCSGSTMAVEALELIYNEDVLSLDEILLRFFSIIDPFALNYQGNDVGTQYRSGIYSVEVGVLDYVRGFMDNMQSKCDRKMATEVLPLESFYRAESYHQKYLQKNPNGYCHIDISGALREI